MSEIPMELMAHTNIWFVCAMKVIVKLRLCALIKPVLES